MFRRPFVARALFGRDSIRKCLPSVVAAALLTLGAATPSGAEAVSFDTVAAAPGGPIFPGNTRA
jgi:hypothetical protein